MASPAFGAPARPCAAPVVLPVGPRHFDRVVPW